MEHATRSSRMSRVFLGLAVGGSLLPLAAILPWFSHYGVDLPRFLQELFSNRVSAFFAWGVMISALVVLVAASWTSGITGVQRTIVSVGTLRVGVSCGLPLLRYFWTRRGVVR